MIRNPLMRNGVELYWCSAEIFANLVDKLDHGEEIAGTKSEAHSLCCTTSSTLIDLTRVRW
jgi:hypothetical protein